MERAVAVNKLRRLLGKQLGYRVDDKAPSREEREAAKERHAGLTLVRNAAEKAMTDRREALLAGDEEYQRLRNDWLEARRLQAEAASTRHHYKFTVGISGDMFFHVKASGDSWEEVIEKVTNGAR